MSAIIWKEIRENLKWGVLLMLVVAAAMARVLYPMSNLVWGAPFSLLDGRFRDITMYGTGIGAALLGLLQTVPELLQNQWAFLIHRPLARRRLFLGKVIAGLGLYAAGILLPLSGAAIWVATPGHIAAPFHWQMLLPALADLTGGVGFYFAGILTGIRQARWYGSRALPFVMPILCRTWALQGMEFWQAMVVAVLCAAVLAAAAWGSFAASGQYRSQPAATKAPLVVVLLVGALGVGGLGATIVASSLERGQPAGVWEQYYIDKEGRALLISTERYSDRVLSVTDLAGHPVGSYKGDADAFREFARTALLPFSGLSAVWPPRFRAYRSAMWSFHVVHMTEQLIWYYDFPERLVVGYDRATRRRIGAISPGGFSPVGTRVGHRFPEGLLPSSWSQTNLLTFPSAVYHIDYDSRRLRLLLAATPDRPILGANDVRVAVNGRPTVFYGTVTAARIHLFTTSLQPARSFPCHYPPTEYPRIYLAALPNGAYVVWYRLPLPQFATPTQPDHVVILSPDGVVLNRYDLPPIPRLSLEPAWEWAGLAWMIPAVGAMVCRAYVAAAPWLGDSIIAQEATGMLYRLSGNQPRFWVTAGAILIVGAVLSAVVVFIIARRYTFSRRQTLGWALAGLVLGPAGILTLLALREWPARVVCPSCGRMRVVDREACWHCSATFPPPPSAATDIFDEPGAPNPLAALPI
jgi:hypothetical protein